MAAHILIAHVQQFIQLDSTVGEGAERPLLLEVGSNLRVGNRRISLRVTGVNIVSPGKFTLSIA